MENIKEIVAEGQKLSEKRTWLVKGYEDLFAKINAELLKIPDMDECKISYLVREYKFTPNIYEAYGRKVYCNLVLEGDAYIQIILKKEDAWESKEEIVKQKEIIVEHINQSLQDKDFKKVVSLLEKGW